MYIRAIKEAVKRVKEYSYKPSKNVKLPSFTHKNKTISYKEEK